MFLAVSALFAFLFGAVLGSFLNVVIHRVPLGLSVVTPRSRCPSCANEIAWYDNIPILSWFILGGRCRRCGEPFSGRYAAVEALMGLLSALLWCRLAVGPLEGAAHWSLIDFSKLLIPFALYFAFLALCVAIAFIDLEHFIIPHGLALPGIALGLASPWILGALFTGREMMQRWPPLTPSSSMIGAVLGAVSVISIFLIYLLWRGVAGMGGGDVTLMAMMGAWLGWPALLFIFLAASVQGLIAAGVATALGLDFVKDASEVLDEENAPLDEPASPGEQDAVLDLPAPTHAEDDEPQEGEPAEQLGAAIPFGPFIVLAGLEHFFLGPLLPESISMLHLYLY